MEQHEASDLVIYFDVLFLSLSLSSLFAHTYLYSSSRLVSSIGASDHSSLDAVSQRESSTLEQLHQKRGSDIRSKMKEQNRKDRERKEGEAADAKARKEERWGGCASAESLMMNRHLSLPLMLLRSLSLFHH